MLFDEAVDPGFDRSYQRHSSITITADTYISVLPETARAAAEAAAAVVPKRGRPTLRPASLALAAVMTAGERLAGNGPFGAEPQLLSTAIERDPGEAPAMHSGHFLGLRPRTIGRSQDRPQAAQVSAGLMLSISRS